MGRLLRLLLSAVARGMRAIAGRLTPVEPVPAAAPEPLLVEDVAGGPPGHWLEMVRMRAPGLHMSLQERGVARMPRRPVSVYNQVAPPMPAESALEPRARQADRRARRPPSAAAVDSVQGLPATNSLRPMPDGIATSAASATSATLRHAEEPLELDPHSWESAASDLDQEDWTRATAGRRKNAQPGSPAPVSEVAPAARRLSAVDATVADALRSSAEAVPFGDTRRVVTTRPRLRPLSIVTPPQVARHSVATPVFAPSRDEDQTMRRPVRERVIYPTPVPTPWRTEAFHATVQELVAPQFPSLPDEVAPSIDVPASATLPAPASIMFSAVSPPLAWSSRSQQAATLTARPRFDSSDHVGAWPTLPEARNPALHTRLEAPRTVLPDVDRWPDLPCDESDEGNDPDLSWPSDHRGRLDREQRGLSWNG